MAEKQSAAPRDSYEKGMTYPQEAHTYLDTVTELILEKEVYDSLHLG